MKNCCPFAKSFVPLTEIVGIALVMGARAANARRTNVYICNMMGAA